MKARVILIILFLTSLSGLSQNPPIRYGKLDDEIFNIAEYQGADAVILCDYGEYYLNGRLGQFFYYYKRHLRIKILTEEGLKYATQSIPYYDLKKATVFEQSTTYELRAQTLNAGKNGKTEKTKLKYKDISKSPTNSDYNTEITLHFQNVKVGSVIEYEINIPTINMVNPPAWYMQYDIPVLWSELGITTPSSFIYDARLYNSYSLDSISNISINTNLYYNHNNYNLPSTSLRFIKKDIPPISATEQKSKGIYIKIMLEFASRKNAPPGMENLYKALDPNFKYLDKYEKSSMFQKSGFVLYEKPNLDNLSETLMKDASFGPPLLINLGINDTIKKITAQCKNDNEKATAIYNYVNERMVWDSTYRVFVNMAIPVKLANFFSTYTPINKLNTSLSRPLKKLKGSSSEINFILINLLNSAGIKASPVLVSRANNEIIDTSFFNLHQFNHVIAHVELNGENFFLDAVPKRENKSSISGANSEYGLIIRKEKAAWIDIKGKYY